MSTTTDATFEAASLLGASLSVRETPSPLYGKLLTNGLGSGSGSATQAERVQCRQALEAPHERTGTEGLSSLADCGPRGYGCGVEAVASEFPFVCDLPKRKAGKVLTAWDRIHHLAEVIDKVGPIVPQSLCAKALCVSRSRVGELLEKGLLEMVEVDNCRWVTKRSLVAYGQRERLRGRPVKGASLRESLRGAWEASQGR